MVTPVRDQKITPKTSASNPRRSISLNKPNGMKGSHPSVKSTLNTQRSIMTPTSLTTSKKLKSTQSTIISSTPKTGPVLAKPILTSTSNVKSHQCEINKFVWKKKVNSARNDFKIIS